MKNHGSSPEGVAAAATAVALRIGDHRFLADLQDERALRTCRRFRDLLPFSGPLIHARWREEAGWMPLGDIDPGSDRENPATCPSPGEMLPYPGGASECEILLACGASRFASKAGQVAGNPLLGIRSVDQRLAEIGREPPRSGAMEMVMEPIGNMPFDRG